MADTEEQPTPTDRESAGQPRRAAMPDDHVCPADPFVRPASDLATLDSNITDALDQLRKARAAYQHSPNSETQRDVDLCEWRLDHLLARRSATTAATV